MRYVFSCLAFFLFFSSCADNSKSELAVFRAADEGLRQSMNSISISSNVIYKALEDRLTDPRDSEKAKLWYPKAMQVKLFCDSFYKYISVLKEDLKTEAGFNKSGDQELYKDDNVSAVNRFSDKNGEELFEKLVRFREDILSVDSQLNKEFKSILVVVAIKFDYTKNDPKAFKTTFFNNIPAIAAMVMLSKFENNVKIIENNFVSFCHNKTGSVSFDGEGSFIMPLVTQSNSYVKAGDEIELNAGIGYFSTTLHSRITINQKFIQLNENGVASYKFKTSLKAGKYSVPVKIEFTKPDGTVGSMTKNIEYTVIEPNQNPQ